MELTTQEDKAYDLIKGLIVSGDLPTGEFLSQRKLAGRVGAAVITVRGALRRLENDGLIENVPRWGVRVPAETPETVQDRYFMREILEVGAVRHMAGRWAPEQADRLRELARACDACDGASEEDVARFSHLHQGLHQFIAECTGSQRLVDGLTRLLTIGFMQANARRGWARGRDRGANHHSAFAEELLSGDPDRAEQAMREHVARGLISELEMLQ